MNDASQTLFNEFDDSYLIFLVQDKFEKGIKKIILYVGTERESYQKIKKLSEFTFWLKSRCYLENQKIRLRMKAVGGGKIFY